MDTQDGRAAGAGPDASTRRRLIRTGAAVATAADVAPSMRTLGVAEAACRVSFGLDVEVAGCKTPNGQVSGHIRLDNCFPASLQIDSVQFTLCVGESPVSPSLGGKHDQSCELLQAGQTVPPKGCATVQFTATVSGSGTIVATATVCGTPQGSTWCGTGGAAIGSCLA